MHSPAPVLDDSRAVVILLRQVSAGQHPAGRLPVATEQATARARQDSDREERSRRFRIASGTLKVPPRALPHVLSLIETSFDGSRRANCHLDVSIGALNPSAREARDGTSTRTRGTGPMHKRQQFSAFQSYLKDRERRIKRLLSAIEKRGVEGALDRCRVLVDQINRDLRGKKFGDFVNDVSSFADFQVSIERAASLLDGIAAYGENPRPVDAPNQRQAAA